MKRRALLTLMAPSLAGCLTSGSNSDNEGNVPENAQSPPEFPDADKIIYPGFKGGNLELSSNPFEATLPSPTIEHKIENNGVNPFVTNLHDWQIHRYSHDEWWFLGLYNPLETLEEIGPFTSHAWKMTIANGKIGTTNEQLYPSSAGSFQISGIGSGIYTFSVVGQRKFGDKTIAIVSPFIVSGKEARLVPGPNLETTRKGDVIEVTDQNSPNGDKSRIVAIRHEDVQNAQPLVPEWALRQRGIRNTAPFISDEIKKVVYTTTETLVHDKDKINGEKYSHRDYYIEFNLSEV